MRLRKAEKRVSTVLVRGINYHKSLKSVLANPDHTANLSGLVLGCIEAYVSRL